MREPPIRHWLHELWVSLVNSSPFAELSGRSLMRHFASEHLYERIFPDFAALSHVQAVERILAKADVKRNFFAWEIPCFWSIGNELRERFSDQLHSIYIQAAHTHWDIYNPIIYRHDMLGDRYLVESTIPDFGNVYKPVSFVWSGVEILPYEWADSSVHLDELQLSEAYRTIARLFSIVAHFRFPIGLGVSFRFKEILTDKMIATVEMPLPTAGNLADGKVSQVIRQSDISVTVSNDSQLGEIERVGWHLDADGLGVLTEADVSLLRLAKRTGIAPSLEGLGSLLLQ